MSEIIQAIPARFTIAYRCIHQLADDPRYLAAFIFGPLGGQQPISENNCSCEVCMRDLLELQKAYERVHSKKSS